MKYRISPQVIQIADYIRQWLREGHTKPLLVDLRSQSEVRLVPLPTASTASLPMESRPGCTISIQGEWILVQCAEGCRWIEERVVRFFRSRGLIGKGEATSECPKFVRRVIVHDHLVGRPVSEQVRARARADRENKRALHPRRFRNIIDAVRTAVAQAGGWIVLTERALESAEKSDFRDPDYIYELIVDLGVAAKQNSKGGLNGTWLAHLGANGGHDFVANTSKNTVEMFPAHYHVEYGGRRHCIGAHVRCGGGTGQDLARVYFALPERPGAPLILGHIGSHLPIHARSH